MKKKYKKLISVKQNILTLNVKRILKSEVQMHQISHAT